MIHVIASIHVKAGRVPEFLEIFNSNVPNVKGEKGCIDYVPTVDVDAGLPPQSLNENRVTVIETWASLEALHAHLKSPHMRVYREQVKDLVTDVSLNVLEEA
ncbi:putative quinol monooxygenase [uncultured Desulfosarcina sp.]|uniref:putative quinol monooxygenase n=1 Tax=uncultured Desulfosarcina sp. TaxID=218289 RepID=UPI0029C66566|nr:putative quinol monooxygenase [uncultured Desulfosarcina sp.]